MPTEPSGSSAGIAASQRRRLADRRLEGAREGRWANQTVVLVVDDAVEVSRMICRHLEKAGLPCAMAKSPDQALVLIAEGLLPAVVLIDLGLPDLLGPLTDRLRSSCPDTPVLFMSGWVGREPDPADVAGLRWSFLQKPFSGTEVVEAVQHLLQLTSANQPPDLSPS
jgi:two-component system OmpR family response regulator